MQTEAAECGLACCAMVAGYYRHHVSLTELRATISVSLKGVDLRGLIYCADQLNFNARPVRVELEDVGKLQLPTIVHMNFNHFVVVTKVTHKHVYISDPANGELRQSFTEFSKDFTGVALELFPNEKFEPKKKEVNLPLTSLFRNISGVKQFLAQIFLLTFTLQIFTVLVPYFVQVVVDDILLSGDTDFLFIIGCAFLFLVSFRALSVWLRGSVIIYLSSNLSLHLISRMFRHLLKLDASYFEKRHLGDIQSRFSSLDQIKELLTTEFVTALVDGVMVVATMIIMYFYSPLLTLITLLSIMLYATYRIAMVATLKKRTAEQLVNKAKEDSIFLESIRGIIPLKNFGKEPVRQSVWLNAFVKSVNSDVDVARLELSNTTLQEFLGYIEQVIIVWLAAYAILDGDLTIGMLIAFLAFRQRVSDQARLLVDKIMEFRIITVHLQRISDIILAEPEKYHEGMGLRENFNATIELRNVSFRYADNENWVLDGVNLTINDGECVAITGPSGAGKSTLLKSMLGLLHPQHGEILFDDTDIRHIGMKYYRQNIAVVMQDDALFSGSIKDNISMFDPEANDEQVRKCAKDAGIMEDILGMPMGFSSLVGDMGSTLSGGQKQRLLVARALYKQPRLLFMDEATSHLDPITERKVNNAIRKLGITRIIIAHREETILLADRVIEIDKLGQAVVLNDQKNRQPL